MSSIPGGIVAGTTQFLRTHRPLAFSLPEPTKTWAVTEAPETVGEHISKLLSHDCVEVVEKHATRNGTHHYKTRRSVFEWVHESLDQPTTLACGHPGIRNLGSGEYTCRNGECTIRAGRDEAREVLDG